MNPELERGYSATYSRQRALECEMGRGAHDGGASCHYGENLEFARGTRGFSGKDASESGGTRTLDPRIKSPLLYRLSYALALGVPKFLQCVVRSLQALLTKFR